MRRIVTLVHLLAAVFVIVTAAVALAQAPSPTPRPPSQPQTAIGREIDALGGTLVTVSNETNDVKLLVITLCLMTGVQVIIAFIDRRDAAADKRRAEEKAEADEKAAESRTADAIAANRELTASFTEALNLFREVAVDTSATTALLAEIRDERRRDVKNNINRDRTIYQRIEKTEKRLVQSLEIFGARMIRETGTALKAGQKAATELILEQLPLILPRLIPQIVVPAATGVVIGATEAKKSPVPDPAAGAFAASPIRHDPAQGTIAAGKLTVEGE